MILAIAAHTGEVPRPAWVALDSVEVLVEPDDAAYSTGRLNLGQKVTIRREGPSGWMTLEPPPGAFSLIAESDIEEIGVNRAKVTARITTVRPGREGAKLPGPPGVSLKEGSIVRLLDRRPLVVRQDREARTWVAIAPPRSEVRFVRSETLTDVPEDVSDAPRARRNHLASIEQDGLPAPLSRPSRDPSPAASPPIDVAADFLTTASDSALSPELAERARPIADRHRQVLRTPMPDWDLSPIESAYKDLLPRASDSDRHTLETRIAVVKRQGAAAQSAKSMAALIARSRERDRKLAKERGKVASIEEAYEDDFDASGLLQTTSRLVEGRRVHALLGDDGAVVCYLAIPPGLSVKELISRRVGVRGQGRYNETLRMRLIEVRDVEILKPKS